VTAGTHGTTDRYHDGCGCSACVLAVTLEDEDRPRPIPPWKRTRPRVAPVDRWCPPPNGVWPGQCRVDRLVTGELAVECWCRRAVVYVEPGLVRACPTDSCGRDGCGP
jgi:hypothetical protein